MLRYFVDMAAAVPDGLHSDDVLWWCDCPQCMLSTEQHACHDMTFQYASSLSDYRHAAHAMIYAIHDRVLFNTYRIPADIMVCHNLGLVVYLKCGFAFEKFFIIMAILHCC